MTTAKPILHVLYVEDNSVDADLTIRELARLAPEIVLEIATTLSDAMERLAPEFPPFDVALTDLSLPDGSGIELLTHIRGRELPLAVVIITGSGDQEAAVAALKAGAEDYLVKRTDNLTRLPQVLYAAKTGCLARRERLARILRVLYVEPNAFDVDLTRRFFAQYAPHIHLEVVGSGEEALALLPLSTEMTSTTFDILLLDYMLPGMNALEVIKILRQERDLDFPIVLVTGHGNEEVAVQALRLGIDDYLVKLDGYIRQLPLVLDQVQKQTELRLSEKRYRLLFESSTLGLSLQETLCDAQGRPCDHRFLQVNPAYAQMLGLKVADLLNHTILEVMPQLEPMWIERYGRVALTGEPDHFEKFSPELNRYFEISLYSPQHGQVVELLLDISDRKQTEIYKDISRDVLLILNEPGTLKDMIPKVISMLKARTGFDAVGIRLQEGDDYPYFSEEGFPKELLLKENSLIVRNTNGGVCRDKDGNVFLECTCGLVITGKIEQGHPFFTQGGSFWTNDSFPLLELPPVVDPRPHPRNECIHHKYASVALVPIRDDKRIVGLIQFNDLRKDRFTLDSVELLEGVAGHIGTALMRKMYEDEKHILEAQLQQSQKMESVGSLAGGIAHDFNNKLTVILGCSYMAPTESNPAKLQNYFEYIRKAAEQSADLTRQLLAFARKQTIAPKVLDLNGTVSGMLKMLQRLIGEDIHLNWHPSPNLWPVNMDPSQIDQILANLCVNARDSIADIGKITIETGNIAIDKEYCAHNLGFVIGEYVKIAVSDSGCGMDKVTMAQIFEPFFTTKGPGEGTGLGLATVFGIVKQNNGFIKVYSEPEMGTTFTVYLPRYVGKVEQALMEGEAEPAKRGLETILLVEDEPSILDITKLILAKHGYTILAANTPAEAIRIASEHASEIHLLMTDVVMPEMNGRDLAKKLQFLSPKLKCLYMSGYTANVIAHHGVLDTGVHFIQKPFAMNILAAKVREVLDGK